MPRTYYIHKFPNWNNRTSKTNEYYILHTPDFDERDFYRQIGSLNCFFYGSKRKSKPNEIVHTGNVHLFKNNHSPDAHTFMLIHEEEYQILPEMMKRVPVQTFDSIWEFYKFIGYDYKTRKWSGY